MTGKRVLGIMTSCLLLLTGCGNWILTKRIPVNRSASAAKPKDSDIALQNLCDVDRIRTRNELLSRLEIEKFRELALKISRSVNHSDVEDLKRLEKTRKLGRDLDPEIKRRRAELIEDIYRNATIRAGFRPGVRESLENTDFTYVASVDLVSIDIDLYVNLLVGTLEKASLSNPAPAPNPAPSGDPTPAAQPDTRPETIPSSAVTSRFPLDSIAGLTVGVSPDQSRLRVGLLRVYRYDPQPDGSMTPRLESISLSEQIEEMIPHRCQGAPSGLTREEIDTLEGLSD